MNRLVLDTHILVWFVNGDVRVGQQARAEINSIAKLGGVHVSAITPWEISMLAAKGRLAFSKDIKDWIDHALSSIYACLEPLSIDVAVASARLPGVIHGDPADRIIVATARSLSARLVTVDEKLLSYAKTGNLRVLEGSR